MSALGQKQASEHDWIMSALPPKADIRDLCHNPPREAELHYGLARKKPGRYVSRRVVTKRNADRRALKAGPQTSSMGTSRGSANRQFVILWPDALPIVGDRLRPLWQDQIDAHNFSGKQRWLQER